MNIVINEKWCKRCGLCASKCPKQVLVWKKDAVPAVGDLTKCVGCKICEMSCPDFALEVHTERPAGTN